MSTRDVPAAMRSDDEFCDSNFGTAPERAAAAAELGTLVAQRGMTLAYGLAQQGSMAAPADAFIALPGGSDATLGHQVQVSPVPALA